MNLSRAAKVTRVSNGVAAGTSDVNSSSVDMRGFSAVQFMFLFGAITTGAVTSIKLQGSSDNSNWSDLEGTSQTVTDAGDDKAWVADLNEPRHRYVRGVIDRGTQNAVIDGIVAMQYRADKEPVTHDASVGGSEFHHAPKAGVA